MPPFRAKPRPRFSLSSVILAHTRHCPLPTCPLAHRDPAPRRLKQEMKPNAHPPPGQCAHVMCSCQPCSCARAASGDDQRRYLQVRGRALDVAQGAKRRLADATDTLSHLPLPPCPKSPLSILEPHPEGPHAHATQAPCETSRRAAHPTAHEECPRVSREEEYVSLPRSVVEEVVHTEEVSRWSGAACASGCLAPIAVSRE